MAQIIVRRLSDELVRRLKIRAKSHQRSLEAEVRSILEASSEEDDEAAREAAFQFAAEMRRRTAGRITGDSADLIREDRDR